MNRCLFTVLFFCFVVQGYTQYFNMVFHNGSTVSASSGNFLTGDYIPGQTYTMTICSDSDTCHNIFIVADSVITGSINFSVYDGNSVSAPLIGTIPGTGFTFNSSPENIEGCLTLSYTAPISGAAVGGYIGCFFNCQPITVELAATSPEFTLDETGFYLNTCGEENISFTAQAVYSGISYEQNDENSQYYWTVDGEVADSGQIFNYIFSGPGNEEIGVFVVDQYGCQNNIDTPIHIHNPQTHDVIISPDNFSVFYNGDSINLNASLQDKWFECFQYDTVYLPNPDFGLEDGSFEDYVELNCFPEGRYIQSIDEIEGILVNIEHSCFSDLNIFIRCDYNVFTGGMVIVPLETSAPGCTYLGVPLDGDDEFPSPGVGWDYIWTTPENADYPMTMGEYSEGMSTLPSGSYLAEGNLEQLVGCLLNEKWYFTITDDWTADNGFVFKWQVLFKPEMYYENDLSFDSCYWSGSNIVETGTYSAIALPDSAGEYVYQLHVTDLSGCSHTLDLNITVVDSSSLFTGILFADENLDCIKNAGESGIPGRLIEITPGPFYGTTDLNGNFSVQLEPGNYSAHLVPSPSDSLVCPFDGTIPFTMTEDIILPPVLYANHISVYNDLSVEIASGIARVGASYHLAIKVKNNGMFLSSPFDLTLSNDTIISFYYCAQTPELLTDSTVTFEVPVISPGDDYLLQVKYFIPENPELLGYELITKATIFPPVTDSVSLNNIDSCISTIVSSFDPNMKEVFPEGEIYLSDSVLNYTIHFQNTGNDSAINIVIIDTLSSFLDVSTISFGPSSHSYTWNVLGEGIICFRFENIFLPDSTTNEPLSHGFVSYSIETKSGLTIGYDIENKADIYFDYNIPVSTNVALNTIVEDLTANDEVEVINVTVYPNPTNDFLNFLPERIMSYQITDLNGKRVAEGKSDRINIKFLSPGIYILQLFEESRPVAGIKFIKE
ncbi:MAG TPA: hypothetical protein DEA97_00110 [Bacteroidales bacterium]|nr:hypothetical protein [Bacteroidales bacterium]